MWIRRQSDQSGRAGEEGFTFLGECSYFKGVAIFVGTVRIDGRIEGEIHTKGRVEVGKNAVVEGTITAGELISNGRINGNVTAANQVRLLRCSVLIGEVHTPVFSMEEGAHFEGLHSMGREPSGGDGAVPLQHDERPASEQQSSSQDLQGRAFRTRHHRPLAFSKLPSRLPPLSPKGRGELPLKGERAT
ncbi:MAG: polymer-forming cytoskeletal protein [Nitrospirae bacterium]|nr:MAG: polymer-forming cytoskeletal protein [Nitrospirota bacterium]TLY43880.1 MAG: polymer-forming cytoskeletal protein [Nitrospirota bacterium]